MPYIKEEAREQYNLIVDVLCDRVSQLTDDNSIDGDLNYIITNIILNAYQERNYKTWNRIQGLLAEVSNEIRRRKTSPYEDMKIDENGDLQVFQDD